MYIENENTATERLRHPVISEASDEDDPVVEFNDDGRARVTQAVGEALADELDAISIVERETTNESE